MAGDVSADTHEVKAYAAAMHKAPQVLKRETITAVNRVTTQGEAIAKRSVPTDTHNLQRSITMSPAREFGGAIRGAWGTNVPYARVMEEGRSPGAAMPPSGALLGWMARHGIDESLEFVVRRAIGMHGIVGKRYMKKAHDEVKPFLSRELHAAVKRTLATIKT
jgi:hypothetical protein